MSTFVFNPKINDPFASITESALGGTGDGWTDTEVGKCVKLGTANNYVLCADGNEIEGVCISMEPITVNSGFSFGTVQKDRRMNAVLDTGETGVAVGDLVVAGAQAAVGTANSSGYPVVATGTPTTHKWRVIRLLTAGEAGDIVVIERI